MMGLWVGPGSHEIQIAFRPVYWGLGLAVAGLCGGLLMILWAVAAWRSLAKPADVS